MLKYCALCNWRGQSVGGSEGTEASRGAAGIAFATAKRMVRPKHAGRETGSMGMEILTPAEMAEADRLAIEAGPYKGIGLMRRAGEAVAAIVLERFPAAHEVHVLCGPGNNGGDGYGVAGLLKRSGVKGRI